MPRAVIITPHQVYRYFDKYGVLLYVGCSLNARTRLAGHRARAEWFDQIARMTIEDFPSKEDGLNAERAAIRSENPKYNQAKYGPFFNPMTPLPDLAEIPKTCARCGRDFIAHRSTAKFCSSHCRVYHSRGLVHKPNLLGVAKAKTIAAKVPQKKAALVVPRVVIAAVPKPAPAKPAEPPKPVVAQPAAIQCILARLPSRAPINLAIPQIRLKSK